MTKDCKWPADAVDRWSIDRLIPYARNARQHSAAQIDQIAASMQEWGWTNPVLVDPDGGIIAGHGRVEAARKLGIDEVPVMVAAKIADMPSGARTDLAPIGARSQKDAAEMLNVGKRAMAAAKVANLGHGQRQIGKFAGVATQAEAAEMLNVSERSIRSARSVRDQGAPELVGAVERGEVSVSAAADIATQPQEEQRKL